MSQLLNISSPAELDSALKNNENVVVDFYAEWCGPCKQLAPVLDMIVKEKDNVTVCKVNVDNAAELTTQYGVSSIPAVFYFKNGEQAHTTKGFLGKNHMFTILKNYLQID